MSEENAIPSLCDWAGGPEALRRLARAFYAKVPADPLLGPVFAGMPAGHADRVARFIAEVLEGGPLYSGQGGSHALMISKHLGRQLTEAQRRRWVSLLLETADEAGLPDDPEFRSAFVGYLEWGSRLAVLNSRAGVSAPDPVQPMPRWNWGPPGGPYRAS
ncbi:group II truncated hemoglobin [Phenylobacterium montanum]|uniref:Group II truncated hemoglobin n=1 Tax=Phenylobacterium montanum TaxID=2823693 RepID=A0A975IT66_9CAUL|nr:group II truncated hemoglobin [Caulobacter sp. S6]QUD86159.1 group II truncated hemoglobin [Caulobacter sp. S6]